MPTPSRFSEPTKRPTTVLEESETDFALASVMSDAPSGVPSAVSIESDFPSDIPSDMPSHMPTRASLAPTSTRDVESSSEQPTVAPLAYVFDDDIWSGASITDGSSGVAPSGVAAVAVVSVTTILLGLLL
jgi:hypothetical protein